MAVRDAVTRTVGFVVLGVASVIAHVALYLLEAIAAAQEYREREKQ